MVRSIRWRCELKWLWTLAWTEANFCKQPIHLNLSIARSRRRKLWWLFSTRLLAQRLTSYLSAFPSSVIAALEERRLSVVIAWGEPYR